MTHDPITNWNADQLRREQRLRRVLDGNYLVPGGNPVAAVDELLADIAAKTDEPPVIPADLPQIWLSNHDKLTLLSTVWGVVFANTESFQDSDGIGGELAYLLGAVLRGVYYANDGAAEQQALILVLLDGLPETSPIWAFITPPMFGATSQTAEVSN